nr:oligosaccharide flippase family protein [Sphingobium sp. AS12]
MTYGVTNALVRGLTGLMMLAYAFKLAPEELGVLGLFLTTVTLVDLLSDLSISPAIIRRFHDHNDTPENGRDYLGKVVLTARLLGLSVLAVVGLALFVAWNFFSGGLFSIWPYLPLILLSAYASRSSQLFDAIARLLERPKDFSAYRIFQAVMLIVLGLLLVFWLELGLLGAVTAYLGSLLLGMIYRIITFAGVIPPHVGRLPHDEVGHLLSYGIPLIPRSIAEWGRASALRIAIAGSVSAAQVGIFFLASSLVSMFGLISISIEMWFNPTYMKLRTKRDSESHNKLRLIRQLLLAFITPLYIIAILLMPLMVELVLPDRYAGALPLLAPLLLTAFIQNQLTFQTRQLMFLKRTATVSVVTVAGAGSSFAFAYFFVGIVGIVGVGWATAIINLLTVWLCRMVVKMTEENDLSAFGSYFSSVLVAIPAIAYSYLERLPLMAAAALGSIYTVAACGFVWFVWIKPYLGLIVKSSGKKPANVVQSL